MSDLDSTRTSRAIEVCGGAVDGMIRSSCSVAILLVVGYMFREFTDFVL